MILDVYICFQLLRHHLHFLALLVEVVQPIYKWSTALLTDNSLKRALL